MGLVSSEGRNKAKGALRHFAAVVLSLAVRKVFLPTFTNSLPGAYGLSWLIKIEPNAGWAAHHEIMTQSAHSRQTVDISHVGIESHSVMFFITIGHSSDRGSMTS